jgi:hypothetical protein
MSDKFLSYWLNDKNEIVKVSPNWNTVASEQSCDSVGASVVISRPLDDFLKGDSTIMLMEALLKRIRLNRIPIARDYRCDTPELTRYYKMTLEFEDSGLIRITHIHTGSVPKVIHRQVTYAGRLGKKRCSMCGRLHLEAGWVDINDLPASFTEIPVYYGICEECQLGRWQNPVLLPECF